MRLHVTDRSDLKWCRRYFYFKVIQRLELPGGDQTPALWAGNLGHRCLAEYYGNGLKPHEVWPEEYDKSPLPRQFEEKYGHLPGLMPQVLKRYHHHYTEVQPECIEIISTEQEYTCPIPGTDLTLVGTLDVVFKERGAIWALDHKFYSAVSWPTPERLEHDDQMTGYYHLLRHNFPGQVIGGIYLNCILKAVPEKPPLLEKSRRLSKDKTYTCSYDSYMEAIREHDLDPNDYTEILEYFKNNEPKYFERFPVHRAKQELDSWIEYVGQEGRELEGLLSMDDPRVAFYPAPNSECGFCPYMRPCKIMNERGDPTLFMQRRYVPRVGRD